MQVHCIKCKDCGDIIYSRARHDFHSCGCGKVSIDGGLDYTRILFSDKKPTFLNKRIKVTEQELYDDWNLHHDKYGWIKEKQ